MRKILRRAYKVAIGSNRIRSAWRRGQIKKYGATAWFKMLIACRVKKGRIADTVAGGVLF